MIVLPGFGAPAGALEWPVSEKAIVLNFGANEEGSPVLGTVFEYEGAVNAAGPGDLLFECPADGGMSGLPSPLGRWTALDHGDGIVSVYCRLAPSAPEAPPGDAPLVGSAGSSGWSEAPGFCFFLFDRKERRWCNPAMMMSPSEEDTQMPSIIETRLSSPSAPASGGILPAAARPTVIRQGTYLVSVTASDRSSAGRTLAPYCIVCMVNGKEEGRSLTFETFTARAGVLMTYRSGFVPASQVYRSFPGFEVGEVLLTRGHTSLDIIVSDFAGNTRSIVYSLTVE
ncbi:MAG: hypothetical protein LBR16_04600 [Treponema sp.]|nr:hypothetical protein [Treponema sp.]